jgi:beta-galactosidase
MHLSIIFFIKCRINILQFVIKVVFFQGIFNVTLNNVNISPWNVTGFRFDSVSEFALKSIGPMVAETEALYNGPQILIGHFNVTGEVRDTFLNTAGWGKGVAFVNGHNLGRYWPLVGPQLTLYVPAPYLTIGKNSLILIELEYVPKNRKINFQTNPVLDYPD